MSGPSYIVVKNVRAMPEKVPNDGLATIGVEAIVFTSEENASIDKVVIDLSPLGGDPELPMAFLEDQGLSKTREGGYGCSFTMPLLADPGRYSLRIHANDSTGASGGTFVTFQVDYKRPGYSESILSHANQHLMDRVSASQRIGGNRISALTSGNAAMQQRMALIEKARKQINLQIYTLSAEGLCGRMLDAVLDKAVAGAEGKLLINM